MATGLPAIVSRGAGASEVLTDGENALLVNARDPGGIARAVQLLAEDPALYRRLSERGSAFVRRELSWQCCAERILGYIKSAGAYPKGQA